MKKNIAQLFYVLIALAFLAAVLFLFYKAIVVLPEKINKDNANVFVALIAGTVTIIGYFITRYLERKKLIEQQIRDQKLPTYEEFLDFIFTLFKNTKSNKKTDDKEFEEFFWNFNKKAILWLSDRSLKSYSRWRDQIVIFSEKKDRNKEDGAEMLIALEQLLLDFRKDIGHKNKDFETGNILSVFINDWEKYSKNE